MNSGKIDGDQISKRQVVKVAGAFVAWIIGAALQQAEKYLASFPALATTATVSS